MTDTDRLTHIRNHIETQIEYLSRLIYNHECNIDRPDADEQADYLMALGRRDTLREILAMLNR